MRRIFVILIALLAMNRVANASQLQQVRDKIPFSFVYDGKSSDEFLSRYHTDVQRNSIIYTDPATSLQIKCEWKLMDNRAINWVIHFKNTGTQDTPIIEKILPLDLKLSIAADDQPILHYSKGSTVGPSNDDFIPRQITFAKLGDDLLLPGPIEKKIVSQAYLPYFNLQYRGGGIVGAIGWTGQWMFETKRESPTQLHLRAGQELTHLRLHPGEEIRTPRIVLLFWDGDDRFVGHNAFRKLLIDHYLPRQDGQVVTPLVSMLNIQHVLDMPPIQQTLADIDRSAKIGAEVFWIDASWFPGDFRYDVGSWNVRQDLFPHGLREVSDRAHQDGMKFLLWMEPERLGSPRVDLARQFPQWILSKRDPGWIDPEFGWAGHPEEMLFDLGNDDARKWMTDFLVQRIHDWGIDIFREDRNVRPVRYWRANDPQDRQGITEIKYIEGFYAMWDALHARCPKLIIDSCNWRNTGPDIEVMSRSSGAWTRSEVADCGRLPVANQIATAGLSLYLPLHANICYSLDPYAVRSISTTGTALCLYLTDLLNDPPHRNDALAAKAIAEIKRLRPMSLGDYFPLTPIDADESHWMAWEFDRPSEGDGYAAIFRRHKCVADQFQPQLCGLNPNAQYEIKIYRSYDLAEQQTLTGENLAKLSVQLPKPDSSVLVQFHRTG